MSHAMNAEACKTLERLGYEWKSLDGRHWDWYAQAVKDCLTTECDCPADRMPFGRCCKASPPVADDADLWKFCRDVLKRGAAIESQFSQQGYETFISEIESAARKEDKRLRSMLSAAQPAKVEDDVARDAAIGAAVERAARDLPFGYDIRIEIERDAGTVSLYGPDCEEIRLDFDGDTFAGEINTAVYTALTIHQHNSDADAMPPAPRMENGYE